MQEPFKRAECILDKMQIVFSHFSRSTVASDYLPLYQKNQGVSVPKKLIQEVLTRLELHVLHLATCHLIGRLSQNFGCANEQEFVCAIRG